MLPVVMLQPELVLVPLVMVTLPALPPGPPYAAAAVLAVSPLVLPPLPPIVAIAPVWMEPPAAIVTAPPAPAAPPKVVVLLAPLPPDVLMALVRMFAPETRVPEGVIEPAVMAPFWLNVTVPEVGVSVSMITAPLVPKVVAPAAPPIP